MIINYNYIANPLTEYPWNIQGICCAIWTWIFYTLQSLSISNVGHLKFECSKIIDKINNNIFHPRSNCEES